MWLVGGKRQRTSKGLACLLVCQSVCLFAVESVLLLAHVKNQDVKRKAFGK